MGRKNTKIRTRNFWYGIMWPGYWYSTRDLRDATGLSKSLVHKGMQEMARRRLMETKERHGKLYFRRKQSLIFSAQRAAITVR